MNLLFIWVVLSSSDNTSIFKIFSFITFQAVFLYNLLFTIPRLLILSILFTLLLYTQLSRLLVNHPRFFPETIVSIYAFLFDFLNLWIILHILSFNYPCTSEYLPCHRFAPLRCLPNFHEQQMRYFLVCISKNTFYPQHIACQLWNLMSTVNFIIPKLGINIFYELIYSLDYSHNIIVLTLFSHWNYHGV